MPTTNQHPHPNAMIIQRVVSIRPEEAHSTKTMGEVCLDLALGMTSHGNHEESIGRVVDTKAGRILDQNWPPSYPPNNARFRLLQTENRQQRREREKAELKAYRKQKQKGFQPCQISSSPV